MRRDLTAVLCLVALLFVSARELRAQETESLQEQWQIAIPSHPAYFGMALIDAEGRTTWDDVYGRGFRGYVAHADSANAEMIITNRVVVAHTYCTIQSSDLLYCRHSRGEGSVSNMFVLTRRGAGPKNLMSEIQ
jgi:hypothetical protein